jgi:Spy/CpxP family protein refolding chaperone
MKSAKVKLEAQQSLQQNLAEAFEDKLAQWEKAETQAHEEQLLTAMQAYLSSEKSWREERLMTSLKVRKILSPEQREKLLELRKGFWSRQDQDGGHKKKAHKEERRQRRLDRLERRMERLEQRKADAN